MKILKIIAILMLVYVGIVVAFESLLGLLQPQGDDNLVLTSTDAAGSEYNRVLTRIKVDDHLYVAVNHWPRAWYHRIQDNPLVRITFAGETASYKAVPVTDDAEAERLWQARPSSTVFRILTGFPPRYFVRMEPVDTASGTVEVP